MDNLSNDKPCVVDTNQITSLNDDILRLDSSSIEKKLEEATDTKMELSSKEKTEDPKPQKSLSELLKFSIALGKGGDTTSNKNISGGKNDEKKKAFLKEAIESLDSTSEEIKTYISDFSRVKDRLGSMDDLMPVFMLLEDLTYVTCEPRSAKLFFRLGGIESMVKHLIVEQHKSLRRLGSTLAMDCCQNDLSCQIRCSETDIIVPLMNIAFEDVGEISRLCAISCLKGIINKNPIGLKQFFKHNGLALIKLLISRWESDVLQKTAILILCLCQNDPSTKDVLLKEGCLKRLIILAKGHTSYALEHILQAITVVVEDHPPSARLCLEPEFDLLAHLEQSSGREGDVVHEKARFYTNALYSFLIEFNFNDKEENITPDKSPEPE